MPFFGTGEKPFEPPQACLLTCGEVAARLACWTSVTSASDVYTRDAVRQFGPAGLSEDAVNTIDNYRRDCGLPSDLDVSQSEALEIMQTEDFAVWAAEQKARAEQDIDGLNQYCQNRGPVDLTVAGDRGPISVKLCRGVLEGAVPGYVETAVIIDNTD